MTKSNIEDKLYLNRYQPDNKSHLHVVNPDFCLKDCPTKICTFICPAKVYEWIEKEQKIAIAYEGCLECGTCRYACPKNIDWENPRGGFGVQNKFG